MLFNSKDALLTQNVLLVPYCKHHVLAYHEWMQDPDLREATASEELTIEEEYAMQKSWLEDHDKLTFIVCQPLLGSLEAMQSIRAGDADSAKHMIGDINLFLYDDYGEEDIRRDSVVIGEIELMIAKKDSRRQGYGRAALLAFLKYVAMHQTEILQEHGIHSPTTHLEHSSELAYVRVKINQNNTASISLFMSVGFKLLSSTPNYFGELELRASLATGALADQTSKSQYRRLLYDHEDDD